MPPSFRHEKLRVYTDSIAFVAWAKDVLDKTPKHVAVWDQLDRASDSIPLNIAQGNGRFSPLDRARYFDVARGSALECAACLDVLWVQSRLSQPEATNGKELLQGVVSMLVGLSKSTAVDRLHEPEAEYRVGGASQQPSQLLPGGKVYFDHERLSVYRESIRFAGWAATATAGLPQQATLRAKLDRSSTAIPLAIAEGNGKFTAPDRCRFFENARSAAFQCAACLDTFGAKQQDKAIMIADGKAALSGNVAMLVGLIRRNGAELIPNKPADYYPDEAVGI